MPECVKCFKRYHPDWCVEQEIRGDNVIVCMFCRVDKDSLTITDDDDKVVEVVTKQQAQDRYKQYLLDLSRKPEIAKILTEAKKS